MCNCVEGKKQNRNVTIFVALVYRRANGAAVEHAQAHVIPLVLTRVLDIVMNLPVQR